MPDPKTITRDFLARPIPPRMRETYEKQYALDLPECCTFRDALKLRILQLARQGDVEARKIITERGFFDE